MPPVCQKTCDTCHKTMEVYTNSRRCPSCGIGSLALDKTKQICKGRSTDRPMNGCTIHICVLEVNHKGDCECACGVIW